MARTSFTAAAIAVLLATSASAAETRILWRSATTGVIAAPATPLPIGEPEAISISYDGNGRTFGIGRAISLIPAIAGGSGQFEFALASGNTLPVGIVFNSATGGFSGKAQSKGDFTFNILVHDITSGQYVTTIVRFFVA